MDQPEAGALFANPTDFPPTPLDRDADRLSFDDVRRAAEGLIVARPYAVLLGALFVGYMSARVVRS